MDLCLKSFHFIKYEKHMPLAITFMDIFINYNCFSKPNECYSINFSDNVNYFYFFDRLFLCEVSFTCIFFRIHSEGIKDILLAFHRLIRAYRYII